MGSNPGHFIESRRESEVAWSLPEEGNHKVHDPISYLSSRPATN